MKKKIKALKMPAVLFGLSLIGGFVLSAIEKRKERRVNRSGRKGERCGAHLPYGIYEMHFKRPLDFALSLTGICLLWPLFLFIAILVRIKLGTPVFFTQERPGKHERIFKLYKFRTMTDEKGSDGKLLSDEERLTAFGKKLRSSSLDEIPELFNIVRGDMAIVGPRPLLAEYLPRYNDRQGRRHDVRPGLTGYAQVNGRNELSWEKRLEDDVVYTEHITFLGDLKILLQTIKIVVKREGIHSQRSATMELFEGNGCEKTNR